MAIRLPSGEYACSICNKVYPQASRADDCRVSHDVIYIPFTRTEFNRLAMLMQTGDVTLVTDSLYEKVNKYMRIFGKS